MKNLELEQMDKINGGLSTAAGITCGIAVSGAFFGGIGILVTGLTAGPACVIDLIMDF